MYHCVTSATPPLVVRDTMRARADTGPNRVLVVMFAVRRLAVAGRWLVAVTVCALVAHAAVYQSLLPGDGVHAYLAWYAPLVAAASAVSVLAIVAGGVLPGRGVGRMIGALLPARSTQVKGRTVAGLALGALAFLVAQESLERSLRTGTFTLATFNASTWPMLVAVLALCAAAVLAIGRTAVVLSDVAGRQDPARRGWGLVVPSLRRSADPAPTTAPLGRHAGLRAPPLVA
jgi:hypothetical protein